jgi:hypothetical protein
MAGKMDFDPYDFIDDDWIEAVVKVAAGMPAPMVNVVSDATIEASKRRNERYQMMREMAARTREKRDK